MSIQSLRGIYWESQIISCGVCYDANLEFFEIDSAVTSIEGTQRFADGFEGQGVLVVHEKYNNRVNLVRHIKSNHSTNGNRASKPFPQLIVNAVDLGQHCFFISLRWLCLALRFPPFVTFLGCNLACLIPMPLLCYAAHSLKNY